MSLTRFIEDNQRLLSVLSVFVAVIVVSGQIDSAWANVFRGAFILLALLVWLEIVSNYSAAVAWWKMPRHAPRPLDWLGREQRMYWFGLLLVLGFVLFCAYLTVTFPVTALYVVLAILHSPLHTALLHRCMRLDIPRGRSEETRAIVASVLSGAVTLAVLGGVAVTIMAVARAVT